jgi:nicotinate-nucleotide adenylyltransferase
VPALAISSTDCRDRVERGRPVWYLVPDGVVQYIEKRRLYHRDPALASTAVADGADQRPAYDHAVGGSAHPASIGGSTTEPPTTHLREVPR